MDSIDQFRSLSLSEKTKEGEDSLAAHLLERANYARQKYGGLSPANFGTFLADKECVRYPTRLLFEFGEMGMHQFAQPESDPRDPDKAIVLYIRPPLAQRPELVASAIAYMTPAINYGEVITDEHCLIYGAILQGMTEEEFYQHICQLADYTGAENLEVDEKGNLLPQKSSQHTHSIPGSNCACQCHG